MRWTERIQDREHQLQVALEEWRDAGGQTSYVLCALENLVEEMFEQLQEESQE